MNKVQTLPIRLPSAILQFPSLPRILLQAQRFIEDPATDRSLLLDVIRLDPGLMGAFLRLANSAYYGGPLRVTSLSDAVNCLGYEMVETVVLATLSSHLFSEAVPSYSIEEAMLWKHSIAVAYTSQWLAELYGLAPASEAYLAGLLHDIGKLAMDFMAVQRTQKAGTANGSPDPLTWTEFEQQIARRSHAEVGALVVRAWNLPDRVIEAVACHHHPSRSKLDPRFAAIIHLADTAAARAGLVLSVDAPHITLDATAASLLGCSDSDMDRAIAYAKDAVREAQKILEI